ncbi:Sodium- and chloride-dependent GABA transporter 3 [Collichthys lucidus]|uniref:Transporter n=1 Tax=Collichthys lucidus TaxID=240159 RepID=A0A4U5VQX9_COLLU|nr:Sodium- and chloride-dependent GABA transporter 3 [Collichthys lucidus]
MSEESSRGAPAPDKVDPEESVPPRGKWENNMEFVFSMAGEIIGLGNVWRFPYLCYKNGGGVFFIPYFVFLFFCGIPVFFLETALGQYTSEGGVTAWKKICPMFQGVGFASQVIVIYLNVYYIVVLAWALFYLFSSFTTTLPWATCDNYWNTDLCHAGTRMVSDPGLSKADSNWTFLNNITFAYDYFFLFRVLGMSDTTNTVVYFTASFPYLILFILFIRGVTLPGAGEGLKYYLTPDFSRLADPNVWGEAGTQVFFSDCFALCCLNSATSIFAGFAVFSVLGFMAYELEVSIDNVVSGGPGLVFVTYPKAMSMMPVSSLWAVLFFIMLLFLGLDTQFVCVESLATAITDMFPRQLRKPGRRELLVLAIAVVCFLLGLLFITTKGIVLFQVVDTYGPSGISILIIAIAETIVIGWVYGADRFMHNIEDMIGFPPVPVLKYCWLFITPLICGLTLKYTLLQSHAINVYGFEPGHWAKALGALLIVTPLMCIPVFLLITVHKNPKNMITPSSDLRQAKPHKPILQLCKCVIFKAQSPPSRRAEEGNDKMAMA